MPDLPQVDTLDPAGPASRPRVLTLRRRLEGAALGAVSGGVTGWAAVLLGDVGGVMHWWFVGGLATLAAGLGYRYGRSVVAATVMALTQSS